MPTAEELYGCNSSTASPCPELQLRGRIRRPRYQRRGSVTKFSLSNVLKQVQKEDMEGSLKSSPSRQLWERLYSKMDDRPLKRTALNFAPTSATTIHSIAAEGPVAKRRRGCV